MTPLRASGFLLLTLCLIAPIVWVSCFSSQRNDQKIEDLAVMERLTNIQVPEGYTVEVVAGPDLVDYPMFGMVDETGRLFLFESTGNVYEESEDAIKNPQFRINILEDLDGDGVYDKSTIFADSVGFPQGGVFYQGSLYASSAPDLLKLTDTDGDGVADEREVLLTGWVLNVNANSLIGPFMGPDGWLYLSSAIMGFDVTSQEGERLKGETSRIWRVRPDGSGLEWISAGGMNNPVELTFTEAAEPIGTETYFTDPKAGQRDALVYWIEGGVYPKPNNNIERDKLVRTGELMPVVSKYSRVAPSGIGRYRNTQLGEDFKDNLFSAQFNTHRVLRHQLYREGASFRTEDEVFLSTEDEDFHPTDVLEDGDGSLLVVETGGWFIKGCPLSQVSKPELEGAIYRVRRQGAKRTEDPFGNEIEWTNLNPASAANYLEDARPFVQDRAWQLLIDQGDASTAALNNLRLNSKDVDVRTKAMFALYLIGTEEAMAAVRKALDDTEQEVRIAAARALGLAKDQAASEKLMEIVKEDEPAVRRQAATALGQIGNKNAVEALLAAAEKKNDRFVEHAIIYALISINQPEWVEPGLAHTSSQVNQAALIALDQMPNAKLKARQLTPFLASQHPELQQAALWVASHHPEWAAEMITFLQSRFRNPNLSEEEQALFTDILVSFSAHEQVQKFVAGQMDGASAERKLFLIDVMAESTLKEFPKAWTRQLGQQLASEVDPQVKGKVLELISLRGITSLEKELQQLVQDEQHSAALRIQALGTLLEANPEVSDQYFTFLYRQLQQEEEVPLRHQAASILARGKLSEAQLMKLAKEYLPKADAFILPRLLPVFQNVQNAQIGRALASTLQNSASLSSFSEENLQTVFAAYPAEVEPEIQQLMSTLREVRASRLERLQALESQIEKGDLERGRTLYFGKAICWTCHTIGSEGGKLGPDLTSIQKDRSAHDLLEAVLYPSVSFVREYETYKIHTGNSSHTGVIQKQSPDAIVLGTSAQTSVRIPREEIVTMELLDVSMMPKGLDQLLSSQEMADLMAFILGQDQDPDTDQQILR